MAVDWSELPKDLIKWISERIENEIDLIRFRSICLNWRSFFIPSHHTNIFPFKFPFFRCLLAPNPDSEPAFGDSINANDTNYPFSQKLSKCSVLLINPTPQQDQTRPWLIRTLQNPNGTTKVLQDTEQVDSIFGSFVYSGLFNFNNICVLQLGTHSFINEDVTDPNLDEFVYVKPDVVRVVTCYGKTPMLLGSFSYFNRFSMLLGQLDESWQLTGTTTHGGDSCVFKGRFYALDLLHTVVVGPELNAEVVAQTRASKKKL
ncbi:hypothetical protein QL285_066036 [Trifolium repens]|nr:hypothetical protein QL285_066036 [Trifolium repens]